jgi:alanyl-tRNA synthetase
MTSTEIRRQFIEFFKGKEHAFVPSSPVVPHDDPTLMFANAGMNQFKPIFLGTEPARHSRVANTQKCIRAGGKHNDLDDVGQDTYHHTFFEMLGNWSFGDYFKKEAIEWAWELLTEVWGIPKERLHATYFGGLRSEPRSSDRADSPGSRHEGTKGRRDEGTKERDHGIEGSGDQEPATGNRQSEIGSEWELEPDYEARDLWLSVTDIDPSHVHPGSMNDNFWEMGDTGPCGPCSEIHIDLTPDLSGGPLVNAGDARVIELWNLVFIQFNRAAGGKLSPLPARHVDTGMGFERLCAVLQGMQQNKLGQVSNYDTDVFTPIFDAIRKRTGAPVYSGTLPIPYPDRKGAGPGTDKGTEGRKDAGERDQGIEGSRDQDQYPDCKGADNPEPQASACANAPDSGTAHDAGRSRGLKPAARDQIMIDVSYRVIADHVRCLTFALTDDAIPSNEGRGYVLRRILRRAVRYGRQYLEMHEPFLGDLVPAVVDHMADAFPELRTGPNPNRPRDNVKYVAEIIRDEEESYFNTLEQALKHWWSGVGASLYQQMQGERRFGIQQSRFAWVESPSDDLGKIFPDTKIRVFPYARPGALLDEFEVRHLTRDRVEKWCRGAPRISGDTAFKLHDTHGQDIDDTVRMAADLGMVVDLIEYERLMEEARQRSRIEVTPGTAHLMITTFPPEVRIGVAATDDSLKYSALSTQAKVVGFLDTKGALQRERLNAGQSYALILDATCFYAEQGGQVGDSGVIVSETGRFELHDTRKLDRAVVHFGQMQTGGFDPGQKVSLNVGESRLPTMSNHTSTHVLNWALREVLCPPEEREHPHVQQKGSLVDPEKTRFDFSHNKPLSDDEIQRIDQLVNEQIKANLPVYAANREEDFVDQELAREINTLRAVFGEKYPDKVRVVSIGAPITEEDAKRAGESDWLLKSPKDPKWMKHSVEFCGGTHVKRTAEIGPAQSDYTDDECKAFTLIAEESVAKGIRRVVGVSGEAAKTAIETGRELVEEAKALFDQSRAREEADGDRDGGTKGPRDEGKGSRDQGIDGSRIGNRQLEIGNLPERVADLHRRINDSLIPVVVRRRLSDMLADLQKAAKEQQKQAAAESGEQVMDRVAELLNAAETVSGVTIVVGEVPSAPADRLRSAIDWIRNKTEASAVLLATVTDDKVTLLAGMSKCVVQKGVKAGDLIKEVAPLVGGKGGGRPDMAQGGGTEPTKLAAALDAARDWLTSRVRSL